MDVKSMIKNALWLGAIGIKTGASIAGVIASFGLGGDTVVDLIYAVIRTMSASGNIMMNIYNKLDTVMRVDPRKVIDTDEISGMMRSVINSNDDPEVIISEIENEIKSRINKEYFTDLAAARELIDEIIVELISVCAAWLSVAFADDAGLISTVTDVSIIIGNITRPLLGKLRGIGVMGIYKLVRMGIIAGIKRDKKRKEYLLMLCDKKRMKEFTDEVIFMLKRYVLLCDAPLVKQNKLCKMVDDSSHSIPSIAVDSFVMLIVLSVIYPLIYSEV